MNTHVVVQLRNLSAAIVLLALIANFFTFCKKDNPNEVDKLIEKLRNTDANVADEAYLGLFSHGKDAIPALLEIAQGSGTAIFHGGSYGNENSSIALMEAPRLSLIAIYLIDGLLLGNPSPHYVPVLRCTSSDVLDDDEKLSIAISRYHNWWEANKDLTLNELQQLPSPLQSTLEPFISWYGPLLINADDPGSGEEESDSKTPRTDPFVCESMPDGPDPDALPDSYAWVAKPAPGSSKKPYNCLAWALACHTDRWIQPKRGGGPGKPWMDILSDYGYDAKNPVDCAGPCPQGKGPKIKMVFHTVFPPGKVDDTWVHAMKQDDDGNWSSKNGSESLWKKITDCDAFLKKHYPVPEGSVNSVCCFCKK